MKLIEEELLEMVHREEEPKIQLVSSVACLCAMYVRTSADSRRLVLILCGICLQCPFKLWVDDFYKEIKDKDRDIDEDDAEV